MITQKAYNKKYREENKENLKNKRKSSFCNDCKIPITKESTYCRLCMNKNERHPLWKGNNVGLKALHNWVRRNKKSSEICEHCKKVKKVELANIDGKYKRDVNNFIWLCRSCHELYDFRTGQKKRIFKRKKNGLFSCARCKKYKNREEFYNVKTRPLGISTYCKGCSKILTKTRR